MCVRECMCVCFIACACVYVCMFHCMCVRTHIYVTLHVTCEFVIFRFMQMRAEAFIVSQAVLVKPPLCSRADVTEILGERIRKRG